MTVLAKPSIPIPPHRCVSRHCVFVLHIDNALQQAAVAAVEEAAINPQVRCQQVACVLLQRRSTQSREGERGGFMNLSEGADGLVVACIERVLSALPIPLPKQDATQSHLGRGLLPLSPPRIR
jgi:hypothetical protein